MAKKEHKLTAKEARQVDKIDAELNVDPTRMVFKTTRCCCGHMAPEKFTYKHKDQYLCPDCFVNEMALTLNKWVEKSKELEKQGEELEIKGEELDKMARLFAGNPDGDRFFYVSYAADSKILSHNGRTAPVYSYVILGAKKGSYINHTQAIKAIISQGKHINPVILNIIEISEHDFEWFVKDQKVTKKDM